jgi:tetratricopeptide (TPR) repeat protein
MRRTLLVLALVGAAGVAAALAFSAYSTEREYQRLIAAGDAALAIQQPFQAFEAYSGAVALRPDAMLAHLKRGMAYKSRGELQNAVRDLRRAVALDPSAPRPLELLGDVNTDLGRHERAVASYEQYLQLDDRSATVLYKLGLAHYRNGAPAKASAPLERAVILDQRFAEAHYVLGLCLRDSGKLKEAREALEAAARLAPGLSASREALADVYFAMGQDRLAIDQLETLVALEPARPDRVVAVGLAQARTGRREAAVVSLGRGVERFPDRPELYAALGRVWLQVAEAQHDQIALKKALEALTTASGRAEVSSETLTDLGRALMLSGDPAAAERTLRRAVTRLPVSPVAHLYLGNLLEASKQAEAARDALVRYATLVGDHDPLGGVPTRIANLSVRIGQPLTALRWYERALDEAGPTTSLLAGFADAAWQAGEIERARTLIAEGLTIDPADAALLRLQRRAASR